MKAQEWLPIRPGTDAALAWVFLALINENLVDQPFLNDATVAITKEPYPQMHPKMVTIKPIFLVKVTIKQRKRRSGLRRITGIPEDRIIKLAREIGKAAKPAYICQGWGPQRQANGELTALRYCYVTYFDGQCRHQRRK